MATMKITLPDTIRVALGDTGRVTEVPLGSYSESTIRFAVIAGFEGALANISRGKDENDKALSDDAWARKREKRMAPWLEGTSWGSTSRESNLKPLRDAFLADMRGKFPEHFKADADVEKHMAAVVKEVFGEKEKASFGNWIAAIATQKAKANDTAVADEQDAIMAALGAKAEAMAAERAKATAKLDLSTITF